MDYNSPIPIAAAFVARYKDYRKALAEGDGFGQCRSIGAMKLHKERLCTVFGFNESQIQMLVARAQQEIDEGKEKG